jgi:hypothetical protein
MKNIFLLLVVIISFIHRNAVIRWVKLKTEWTVSVITALLIAGFSIYNYYHLPLMDFRPYKVGTNIPCKLKVLEDTPAYVYEQYFTLMDTVNLKMTVIESKVYMAYSTYWGKLISSGYQLPGYQFKIGTPSGLDITQKILSDTGYYFILIAYDLKKSGTKYQPAINLVSEKVTADGHKFIALTSSTEEEIKAFKIKWNIGYDFYFTDPVTLKTIVRANPGLLVLRKGTILAKWNVNTLPPYETMKSKCLNVKF